LSLPDGEGVDEWLTGACSMPDAISAHRVSLIAAANACMFVFGAVLLLMGSLLPTLQFTYSRSGNLGSFPLAGILVSTILVGPILDLMGAKKVLVVALGLVAASLGVMPTLHSYSGLAAAAFVYGLAGGGLNTAANALVADLSVAGRAAALNLLGFSFSLGAIAAPLMLSSVVGSFSTSVILRTLAIICLVVLLFVLSLRFPPPIKFGTRLGTLLKVLSHGAVWLFAALLFLESGSENCTFVWTSKIVADALHTSPNRANVALVALSAALGGGRIAAALFLRRLGSARTIWLSTAVIVAGSIVMQNATQMSGMVTAAIIIGLGLSAIFPTALGMAGDRFPEQTGTVFGAIMVVALAGGTAGPKIAGWIAPYDVRRVLLIPIFAAVGVAALAVIIVKRSLRPVPKPSS
jgi:MFS transporter, FHS family, glucose/mannose:H+ symporter